MSNITKINGHSLKDEFAREEIEALKSAGGGSKVYQHIITLDDCFHITIYNTSPVPITKDNISSFLPQGNYIAIVKELYDEDYYPDYFSGIINMIIGYNPAGLDYMADGIGKDDNDEILTISMSSTGTVKIFDTVTEV